MPLPDAEALCAELVKKLRPAVTPATAMVGIHTGGAWRAERLHRELGLALALGRLDISFYRDDYRKAGLHKSVKASQIPFDVADRRLLLVDRGERQLPICAQYCGTTLAVAKGAMLRLDRNDAGRLSLRLDDA